MSDLDPELISDELRRFLGEARLRRFVAALAHPTSDGTVHAWQREILQDLEKARGVSLPTHATELAALVSSIPPPETLGAHEIPGWMSIEDLGGLCPVQGWGTVDDWRWYFRARGEAWSIGACGGHGDPEDVEENSATTFYVEEHYGAGPFDAGYMITGEARFFIVRELTRLRAARRR
jgi:hypothetical protein